MGITLNEDDIRCVKCGSSNLMLVETRTSIQYGKLIYDKGCEDIMLKDRTTTSSKDMFAKSSKVACCDCGASWENNKNLCVVMGEQVIIRKLIAQGKPLYRHTWSDSVFLGTIYDEGNNCYVEVYITPNGKNPYDVYLRYGDDYDKYFSCEIRGCGTTAFVRDSYPGLVDMVVDYRKTHLEALV